MWTAAERIDPQVYDPSCPFVPVMMPKMGASVHGRGAEGGDGGNGGMNGDGGGARGASRSRQFEPKKCIEKEAKRSTYIFPEAPRGAGTINSLGFRSHARMEKPSHLSSTLQYPRRFFTHILQRLAASATAGGAVCALESSSATGKRACIAAAARTSQSQDLCDALAFVPFLFFPLRHLRILSFHMVRTTVRVYVHHRA